MFATGGADAYSTLAEDEETNKATLAANAEINQTEETEKLDWEQNDRNLQESENSTQEN